jgi:MinD superfamily P-loop ATPase
MRLVIASGKGGTGKTLVSTHLAASLKEEREVELLDCDVEEPNSHLFFDLEVQDIEEIKTVSPNIDSSHCIGCNICSERCEFNALSVVNKNVIFFPELCHSCGGCILFCPTDAITKGEKVIGTIEHAKAKGFPVITGRLNIGSALAPELIEEVIERSNKNKLSVIDSPPGTSCSAVAALSNADFCLLVTEPTPYGLHDLEKAVLVARRLDVPTAVIINKSQQNKDLITTYCEKEELPILLKIPYSMKIAQEYAEGRLSSELLDSIKLIIKDIEGMI